MHPDFDSLEWAESDICYEFGRGTSGEIERCLVSMCDIFSCQIGVELFEVLVSPIFECALSLPLVNMPRSECLREPTQYPKKVGLHPVKIPRRPSALPIFPQASRLPLYIFESTWRRHFTRSSGVTAVCVKPWPVNELPKLMIPDRYTYTCDETSECAGDIVFG